MREIKFRAISTDTKKWVYGGYYNIPDCRKDNPRHIIVYQNTGCGQQTMHEPIDINTLGEYTGLKDKNGKEIYEEDILRVYDPDKKHQIQEVVFTDGMFCGYSEKKTCKYTFLNVLIRAHGIEVIGNIYENPELMEGKK